jgi:hypothetical protein
MKRQDTTKATSQPRRQKPSDKTDKNTLGKTVGNEPHLRDDSDQKIDRPGFDLGGSSGDTHAGTGLGLGVDASDSAGDRRLPGRRLDNKLTIPRWGGAAPKPPTEPGGTPSGDDT